MLLQILVGIAGADYAYNQGDVVDVPEDIAKDLLTAGRARKVTKKKSEAAAIGGGETAVAKKKKTTKRKRS